jgi:hypothetical protein
MPWLHDKKIGYDKYGRIAKITTFNELTEAGWADRVVTTFRYWGSYNGHQNTVVALVNLLAFT